jgi:hypothetical protein
MPAEAFQELVLGEFFELQPINPDALSRFILDSAIHWDSATLERCNLVYTNGADPGANYVIHIDEM